MRRMMMMSGRRSISIPPIAGTVIEVGGHCDVLIHPSWVRSRGRWGVGDQGPRIEWMIDAPSARDPGLVAFQGPAQTWPGLASYLDPLQLHLPSSADCTTALSIHSCTLIFPAPPTPLSRQVRQTADFDLTQHRCADASSTSMHSSLPIDSRSPQRPGSWTHPTRVPA